MDQKYGEFTKGEPNLAPVDRAVWHNSGLVSFQGLCSFLFVLSSYAESINPAKGEAWERRPRAAQSPPGYHSKGRQHHCVLTISSGAGRCCCRLQPSPQFVSWTACMCLWVCVFPGSKLSHIFFYSLFRCGLLHLRSERRPFYVLGEGLLEINIYSTTRVKKAT